jgi:hypothetical protein
MAPKWLGKVPWTTIAEFFLGWWKTRKKKPNVDGETGGPIQPTDDEPAVDTNETRPAA